MISDKVRPHHLERKAILYVRQSSAHQVLHNRESSALQYAMRDRLTALGWSEIEVIDDDLGRSAAGGVQRAGFERMVAEVCLGKVGAVCAREVSRFARNSRDWQQLIEMCRVVDTVLVDQETIYAPRHTATTACCSGSRAASTSASWICCASVRRGNQDGSAASIRMRELRGARDAGRA
ncbi:recombinase family protein [Bradyrhizobium sp. SSUT112]|uniref:recombinase family protein n=1 Tax=Bradyrhizobium sp. SSUT112 TaxID=3040604 RepID=UPI002449274C|nr:recombinase family protein [Bradyrhizobium sp. SSUT112]MDH2357671.1 recombinase family protein [Bradyrhizobium sp. SSUT112]